MRLLAIFASMAALAALFIGPAALWLIITWSFWTLVAVTIFLSVLPLIPGAIDLLTNRPNGERPTAATDTPQQRSLRAEKFGFFTYLQPGRVKIVERGDTFVRCVMVFPGHMFVGERDDNSYTPTQHEYWEVVPTKAPHEDSNPLRYENIDAPFPLNVLLWVWARWVFKITGAVYTGIYPFQRVRTYPMTKNVIVYLDDGKYRLEVKEDWSDHLRVADFQFPLLIPDVNTQDKIPVKMIINNIFRVFNPYQTSYFTDDDWGGRLLSSVSAVATNFGRAHPLEQVLSAATPGPGAPATDTSMELANALARVGYHKHGTDPDGSTAAFGIMIPDPEKNPPQVLDISAVDPEDVKALGAVARAQVTANAEAILAKGHAAELREQGHALKDFPEAAIIPEVEGRVRTAQAAGDKATIIMGSGGSGSNDALLAAILTELRRRREGDAP